MKTVMLTSVEMNHTTVCKTMNVRGRGRTGDVIDTTFVLSVVSPSMGPFLPRETAWSQSWGHLH